MPLLCGADGRKALLTRAPDLRQAQQTSDIADVRIWANDGAADPSTALHNILAEFGCRGQKLGVEWDAYGLTAARGRALDVKLENFCALEDASLLVSGLRLLKSPAEIAYHRKAAELCDAAYAAALETVQPGVDEAEVLAAMQGAVFRGGDDYPENPLVIGSGDAALLCRYKTGRRRLAKNDQLTLEWAGVYRHYHACCMRTPQLLELRVRRNATCTVLLWRHWKRPWRCLFQAIVLAMLSKPMPVFWMVRDTLTLE
jgi:Xaa-Pro dipeptidase